MEYTSEQDQQMIDRMWAVHQREELTNISMHVLDIFLEKGISDTEAVERAWNIATKLQGHMDAKLPRV